MYCHKQELVTDDARVVTVTSLGMYCHKQELVTDDARVVTVTSFCNVLPQAGAGD